MKFKKERKVLLIIVISAAMAVISMFMTDNSDKLFCSIERPEPGEDPEGRGPPPVGLPLRRCLRPGREDQEGRLADLYRHALQRGHYGRPDRRAGEQRRVRLIPGRAGP